MLGPGIQIHWVRLETRARTRGNMSLLEVLHQEFTMNCENPDGEPTLSTLTDGLPQGFARNTP
jgi:hypothetical protein